MGKKNLMNLLIIGGSGLLGGRLYKHFKEKKYNVKILVRKSKKKYRNFFPDDILKINFYDIDELKKACNDKDIIIHTAGSNSQDSVKNKLEALYIKEKFTKNLIKISNNNKVKKLIFISTVHVYSSFLNKEYYENSKTFNLHPYALSNIKGEKALLNYSDSETEIFILRLSNCFGSPISKNVNCWQLFINDLCKQAIQTKKLIIKQNPKIKRDFLEISNFINCIEFFINTNKKFKFKIINIGSGKSYTLFEITKIIQRRVKFLLGFTPAVILNKSNINQEVNTKFTINIDRLKKLKIKKITNFTNEIDNLVIFCKKNYVSNSK